MILNTFNSSLLIKWSPPSIPNGPIINYTLYITHNSNNTVDIVTIDGQFIFYLLNGVSLNESIQVTVSATTTGGEGPHSSAIVKVLDSLGNNTIITLTHCILCLSYSSYSFTDSIHL